jgi:hypothetical protein
VDSQGVYLSPDEQREFAGVWALGGLPTSRPLHPASARVQQAWVRVADVRDPDLVKVDVLDLHCQMVRVCNDRLGSAQKLMLLQAYSAAFSVYLMMKLPRGRRKSLPAALMARNQYKIQVDAAESYYQFLLDREEAGGSPEPMWEDLASTLGVLIDVWHSVGSVSLAQWAEWEDSGAADL